MAIIELIKKDKKPIFKEGEDAYGCAFYARKWSLKGDIFKCKVEYHIPVLDVNTKKPAKDLNTGKEKKKLVTEVLEFLEEELTLLNIDDEKIFPSISEEESDDINF